jgi:hypothetical protein
MDESMAKRIADVLQKTCPAFHYDERGGPAMWHRCCCGAQAGDHPSCVCVWHQKSGCHAGKWPQLAFVDERRELERIRAQEVTERVRAVISNS